jgi:hypothetical protein
MNATTKGVSRNSTSNSIYDVIRKVNNSSEGLRPKIEAPIFSESPRKSKPTVSSDLRNYMKNIKSKDNKIEERTGFSKSETTRSLQRAYRNTKWLMEKIGDN